MSIASDRVDVRERTITTTKARRAAFAAVALLAVGVTACSSSSKTQTAATNPAGSPSTAGSGGAVLNSSDKVAFLMPDQASTRYETYDKPSFAAALKKLCPNCSMLYNNANADASLQQQQANSAMAQGAKAIVIDAVDSTAAATIVHTAQAQGVKVISYDRPIPSIPTDFYVSFDNEKVGDKIAQSLVDHLKQTNAAASGGGLLLVNGSPTDAAAGLIKKGIHVAVDASGIKVLAEYDTPDWAPAKAQEWVSGQISRFHTQIIGVVAANDGTAGGTVAAFKAAGVTTPPPITGNDATLAGTQYVLSGDQYNTIEKPGKTEADAAANAVVELLKGQKPQPTATVFNTPSALFDPTLVLPDNVESAVVQPGFLKAAEICTSTYAAACQKYGIQ